MKKIIIATGFSSAADSKDEFVMDYTKMCGIELLIQKRVSKQLILPSNIPVMSLH